MAPQSSTLACKSPWTEESGRLQSMRSPGVGHDWATSLSLFTFMHWRRKWQPTAVFLPGESQGWGSLVGCRLWGRRVGHDWSDLALSSSPLLGEGRGRLFGVHHCLSYFWHTDFCNTYLLRKMLILHHGWDRWFEICLCHLGRASLVAQTVKDLLAKQKPGFYHWVRKIPWRREWLPTPVFLSVEFHGQKSLVGLQRVGYDLVTNTLT